LYYKYYVRFIYVVVYISVCSQYVLFSFFFFSSRRRHTRFKCDWSSDVCSSDLRAASSAARSASETESTATSRSFNIELLTCSPRSEERRVGKECRSRWWTDH